MCLACSLVRLELLEGVQAYYARDYRASYNSLKVMGALMLACCFGPPQLPAD